MLEPIDPPSLRRGVAVVIFQQGQFLVILRSAQVAAPSMYCFPGGEIEPGESECDAVRREMVEELGVGAKPVRLLWRSVTPWQVALAWWLAQIDVSCELTPNPAEVESYRWLTAQEMLALPNLLESNRAFLAALASGEIVLD